MNYATGTAGTVASTAAAMAIVRESPEPCGEADPETLTPDELDDMADEIAIRSAHVHAAMGEICRRVARYDRSGTWRLAGETSLKNTMLLCYVHHRLMHEGGWRVEWWGREKRTVFIDPRGQRHSSFRRKRLPLPENPADALIARNRANGVDPDALTAGARWQRERDIPDEVLFRALEALAPEPTAPEPAAPD